MVTEQDHLTSMAIEVQRKMYSVNDGLRFVLLKGIPACRRIFNHKEKPGQESRPRFTSIGKGICIIPLRGYVNRGAGLLPCKEMGLLHHLEEAASSTHTVRALG